MTVWSVGTIITPTSQVKKTNMEKICNLTKAIVLIAEPRFKSRQASFRTCLLMHTILPLEILELF